MFPQLQNQRSDIDTSEIPFSTGTTSIVISSGMQTQAPGSNNNVKLVIENHGKGPPQPNSPGAKSETSETSNQIAATVPLDQNNCVSSTAYAGERLLLFVNSNARTVVFWSVFMGIKHVKLIT